MLKSICVVLFAVSVLIGSSVAAMAVGSDGSVFYDDFADMSKWTVQETDCSPGAWVSDGLMHFDSSAGTYVNACTTNALDYGMLGEWVTEARFRVSGPWGSGLTWTDGVNWRETALLAGMSERPYGWTADYGLLLANGSDISLFNLTWGAFNGTMVPEALAVDLSKDQWYTVALHHKSDGFVDVYLDGNLVANKAALSGQASYVGMLETSGNTWGKFDLDYVSVGAAVPEPSALCVLAAGAIGVLARARRRRG